MSRYHLYTCPNCESSFRVIWPEQLPKDFHLNSKVTITCPLCGERRGLYLHLLDVITCAPDPDRATVQVNSISPRNHNPDPNARMELQWEIFQRKTDRYKTRGAT
jgi:hypothetical protein